MGKEFEIDNLPDQQTVWEGIVTDVEKYKKSIMDKPLGYKLAALTTIDEMMNIITKNMTGDKE